MLEFDTRAFGEAATTGRKDVDLFDPTLLARRRELPAWAPVASIAVAVAIGLGVSGWLARSGGALSDEAVRAEARLATLRSGPDAGAGTEAARQQALQAEVARLRARLEQVTASPDALPVSTVIEGLAAATIDGVWLTRIQFDRTGRTLQLEGRARDARLLPGYLQSLGRQPAFAGLPLATVDAQRGDASPAQGGARPLVSFRIVSATAESLDPSVQRARAPGSVPVAPATPAVGAPAAPALPAPAGAAPADPAPTRPARADVPPENRS